jgi:hypothetical protein
MCRRYEPVEGLLCLLDAFFGECPHISRNFKSIAGCHGRLLSSPKFVAKPPLSFQTYNVAPALPLVTGLHKGDINRTRDSAS